MTEQVKKQRIQWIDLAKGICMLLVVFGHYPDSPASEEEQVIGHVMSSFRMPLYFLLSGLFFKTYDGIKGFTIKKIDHLLVPYVVFYLLGRICPFLDFITIWFLFCLFVMNMLGYCLLTMTSSLLKDERRSFVTTFIISVIMALLTYNIHLENFCGIKIFAQHITWVEAAFVALPFFLMGYGLRHFTTFLSQPTGWDIMKTVMSLSCFVFVIAICCYFDWGDDSYFVNDYQLPFIMTYLAGIIGTIGILLIACQMVHVPVVSYIGRYSIVVLITHIMVIKMWKFVCYDLLSMPHNTFLYIAIYIVIIGTEIPVIRVCIRYLPYIFAQKELLKKLLK